MGKPVSLELALFLPEDADAEYADFWQHYDALNLHGGREQIFRVLVYSCDTKSVTPQSLVQARRIFTHKNIFSSMAAQMPILPNSTSNGPPSNG